MTTVPPALLWALTKKHNSFLVKNNGISLTCDPGNVSNVHSSKASGICHNEAIGFERVGKGGVALVLKRKNRSNKPKSARKVVRLPQTNPGKAVGLVTKAIDDAYYRRDLKSDALKRVAKVTRAANRAALIKAGKLKVVYGRGKNQREGIVFGGKAGGDVEMKDDAAPGLEGAPPGLEDEGPPGLD